MGGEREREGRGERAGEGRGGERGEEEGEGGAAIGASEREGRQWRIIWRVVPRLFGARVPQRGASFVGAPLGVVGVLLCSMSKN